MFRLSLRCVRPVHSHPNETPKGGIKVSTDSCNHCNKTYRYDESRLTLNMYPDSICNHLEWTCPQGHSYKVFVNWAKVRELLENKDWFARRPVVHLDTPSQLRRDAAKAWKEKHHPGQISLPEIPSAMRRELYDLLRDPSKFSRPAA